MKKRILTIGVLLFCVLFSFAQKQVKWEQQAKGIWRVSAGKPEKLDLTSQLNITPKMSAINAMAAADLPINKEDLKFEFRDGKTFIRFPLEKDEKIFGLGLNFKTVEQRGRILRLHMDHYGGQDNGRTHAPVPFFVSSRGYGAFINSARYLDVYVGTSVRKDSRNPPKVYNRSRDKEWTAEPYSDNLEILVPAEGVEIVLFSGTTMLDVVRRFNLYEGGGCMPPKWGLGFWQRVPVSYTDKDVMNEVGEFAKKKFPLSVIGLEPGWMTGSYPCTYEWDKERFPHPRDLTRSLQMQNIQTNVWVNPGVSPLSSVYQSIEPYTASHTEWCGLIPDYTMPEAVKIMASHLKKNVLDSGVSGFKMDENDGFDNWLWPDVASFPSGNSAEQLRQVYGTLQQHFTTDMYRQRNTRTYGLVRASNAGSVSFPYVLYNDYYDHRDFITALVNSSFIGVLWTPEVRASKTSEEWLRRMQTVCFSPLAMLNAWSDGTKPWSFPDVEKEVKAIADLRMQLIPYLYTAFADYTFYGTPPFRAMNLEAGYNTNASKEDRALDGTLNPYALALKKEVKDQFMVGEYLLVAPLFAGETSRQVVLPAGKWYDFYTGKLAGESEVISVTPGWGSIPVFVKDGGMIPMYTGEVKLDGGRYPLEIRHYGQKPSVYKLYDDDGNTYNYEKGEFTRIDLKVSVDGKGKRSGTITIPKGSKVWSFSDMTFRFMTE
ncbi:MAG TPA: TIM-barrel domain-containing protein [Chitinophagaceae bacterium]|nr:TIM-barrel domain-containing protein [Chitinophagaceae bacterium]